MYKLKCNIEALKKAIEEVGSMQNLANKVGVSYQTILNWKSSRSSISPHNCVKIEEATLGKISRKNILPEFPWEELK